MIWPRQLRAVIVKELRQTVRDRRVLALLIIAPMIQLFVLTYAVDLEVSDVATAVVDLDDSGASRRIVEAMLAEGTLRDAGRFRDAASAEAAMVEGEVQAIVIVPAGYARDTTLGVPADVQVVIDGSDPNRGNTAANAARGFFGGATGSAIATRVLYNPGLDTAPFMVPGIAGILLLMVTTIIAAMGLSREAESGTLEQVLVTPISKWVLLVGKLIPFAVVGCFDYLMALGVGVGVFGVPIHGTLAVLALAIPIYLVAVLSLGLMVATFSDTQQQAFMSGFLVMLPAILLSGVLTSIRAMPEWLQLLTWVNPLRHFSTIARASLFRSATFADLWMEFAALSACALVLLVTSIAAFRTVKQ